MKILTDFRVKCSLAKQLVPADPTYEDFKTDVSAIFAQVRDIPDTITWNGSMPDEDQMWALLMVKEMLRDLADLFEEECGRHAGYGAWKHLYYPLFCVLPCLEALCNKSFVIIPRSQEDYKHSLGAQLWKELNGLKHLIANWDSTLADIYYGPHEKLVDKFAHLGRRRRERVSRAKPVLGTLSLGEAQPHLCRQRQTSEMSNDASYLSANNSDGSSQSGNL